VKTINGTLRLAKALLWRSRRQQGRRILLYPLGYAALILGVWLVAVYTPGILTGVTQRALERSAALRFGNVPGRVGIALVMMFMEGPYLVALFSSVAAASIAQSCVTVERSRGGLELLVSAPYSHREIFSALLLQSIGLTAATWLMLAVGFLGTTTVGLMLLGSTVHWTSAQIGLALIMPLPLAVWSNLIALLLAVRFPRATSQGTIGMTRIIAVQPAFLFLLAGNFRPDIDPMRLAEIALLSGVMGTLLVATVLFRRFRLDALLAG